MPDTLPQLPLAGYQFQFQAAEGGSLPEDPRGLWHGVFGLHLRRLACVMPGTECPGCQLLHHCAYSYLFTGPRPPEAELMRRYDRIPVPHVFRIPADFPTRLAPGQRVHLGLTLIGRANEGLPLVLQTLAAAGAAGLGAARVRLLLTGVGQWLPDADAAHPLYSPQDKRLAPALPPRAPVTPPLPTSADGLPALRLRLLTPYQQSGGDLRPEALDPDLLLMAIVRRVSLLQYFYTGERLDADFPALKAASATVVVTTRTLERARGSRYAAGHGRRLDTGGLLGELTLTGDGLAPLWPYLHLGQWLNVGKNASMGLGGYKIIRA